MRAAHHLGRQFLPPYSSPFSCRDFTLPQLFACLVLREMLRLSYRKAEQFLRDSPEWLAEIGLRTAPDHNTLWRSVPTPLYRATPQPRAGPARPTLREGPAVAAGPQAPGPGLHLL